MDEIDIRRILDENRNIPFVDRLFNRNLYPRIYQPNGSYSTHIMEWSTINTGTPEERAVVYPTLEMINGKLMNLREAGIDPWKHALENKNYIEFKSTEDADYFSKNYKKVLGIK